MSERERARWGNEKTDKIFKVKTNSVHKFILQQFYQLISHGVQLKLLQSVGIP